MHFTTRSLQRTAFAVPFLAFFTASAAWAQEAVPSISAGDTAWVLASTALVMLMTPGLGLFYGGMVRRKNVLATIMQSFFLVALIGVQWVIWGYSLAFGQGGTWLGDLNWLFLKGIDQSNSPVSNIPHQAFVMYQAMFAVITPALISGALAERIKFKSFALFSLLWATLVYDPVCHWVWQSNGVFFKMGALDFAGGTVVHMTAGFSALTLALLMGRRQGFGDESMIPHNMTMVLTGTGLLWFGWFGFNAGSALGANALAANAFMNTNTAAAMATLMWCLVEALHRGKPSALGAASGAVAGLVAITPAAGFADVTGALWIGALVAPVCYFFVVVIKQVLRYDDSLDAFGIHAVGGTLGALLTGVFANPAVNPLGRGFLYGNTAQLMVQFKTILLTLVYSSLMTVAVWFVVDSLLGMRAESKDEELGLDLSQHGEEGYVN